jgi:hypothetical protein
MAAKPTMNGRAIMYRVIARSVGLHDAARSTFETPIAFERLSYSGRKLALKPDVQAWVDDNCETTAHLRHDGVNFIVGFENDQDATLFALTFR